jgi:hypothetical protein
MEAKEAKPRLVLSAREVGLELGVSRHTVANLRKRGQLPGTRVAAGDTRSTWRYTPEDVLDYLAQINSERTP